MMAQMIEVVTGPMEGCTYALEEGASLSIGRSSQNDITLPYDPWVSSSHATLKCKAGVVYVMDLHSSNGSYVQGRKVAPNSFIQLREYLIIGSTLCRIGDGKPLERKPLAVKKSVAKPYLANSLAREALRIARDRRSPTVSVVHLFMAALKLDDPELIRFLRSLKMDADKLLARLDKLQIFTGSREWINDFLIYQYKTKEQTDCYLTVRVLDYFDRFTNAEEPFEPIPFVKKILKEPYSILHPMLGIRGAESDESLPGFTEKITLNPYDTSDDLIILPKTFWTAIREALEQKHPLILSGSRGTGKSAILKQCFHALPKINVPHFHQSNKHLFDPEVFLVFREHSDLAPYINRIIKRLRSDELVAIDHFGFLIGLMKRGHLETAPLIGSIKHREAPTILGIRSEHLDDIDVWFKQHSLVMLDDYLRKVTLDILKNLLLEFESEVKCPVSEEASRYLEKELLHQHNLAAIKTYFQFCAEKVRALTSLFRGQVGEGDASDKTLSKAFFQTALDHWASPFTKDAESTSRPSLSDDSGDSLVGDDLGFPKRVEDALARFFKNQLRTRLQYSDGSSTFTDAPLEEMDIALGELLAQLETLLDSFGVGFSNWFEAFLAEMDPKGSLYQAGDDAQHWREFKAWFEDLSHDFHKDHFLEMTRKFLKRQLRQKTIS